MREVGILGLGVIVALMGCQESKEPTTTLTQAQWDEVRQNILETAPTPEFKVGADFGGKIELIGMDVEPKVPKAGDEVTVTWYWKALGSMEVNWQVFVHFDHKGPPPSRQGMDHHPMRDLYQTTRWKQGQVIKDVYKVRLKADYPDGEATFWVGLWDQASGKRLELVNKGAVANDGDNRVKAAQVKVDGKKGGGSRRAEGGERAKIAAARPLSGELVIDGKLDEAAWVGTASTALGGTRGGPGPGGETWFKVLYDEERVVFGLYAADEDAWGSLTARDSKTWTEEVLEIFIDPDGDGKDYVELQITPNNVIFDARFAVKLGRGEGSHEAQIEAASAWNSAMQTATFVDGVVNDAASLDKSWSAELSIPWGDLPGGKQTAGGQWRLNVYRFDKPRKEGQALNQIAWSWAQPFGSFHNVERFGTLRFVGGGPLEVKPSSDEGFEPAKLPEVPVEKGAAPADSPAEVPPTGDEVSPDKPE